MPWPPSSEPPVQAARRALGSLFNVMQAAQEWGVTRVALASTIGVYGGAEEPFEGPLTEDMPLSMGAPHLIPDLQESQRVAWRSPRRRHRHRSRQPPHFRHLGPARSQPRSVLPRPAAHPRRRARPGPELSGVGRRMYAEDSLDLCYVKDTGRAIAVLQLAHHLSHRTYNVASGHATTNAEVAAAIRRAVPDAQVDLPPAAKPGRHGSTSPACARTPATSRPGTPSAPPRTTSPGCGPATTADRAVAPRPGRAPSAPLRRPRARPAMATPPPGPPWSN